MRFFASLILSTTAFACTLDPGGKDADSDAPDSSSGGTFGMGTTTGPSPGTTVTPSTTGADPTTSSTTSLPDPTTGAPDPTTSTTDPTTSTTIGSATDSDPTITATVTGDPETTTEPGVCGDVPNQPLDAECLDESGCGCATGRCFTYPVLGGWCGECLADADCPEGGCTEPNPLDGVGSRCNTGQAGDGCETSAVCQDPQFSRCADIYIVPGIFTISTCGQCVADADCPGAAPNCAPDYDMDNFTGVTKCAANESLPLGAGCAPGDGGDIPPGHAACASGHCGVANVMGLLKVGICSECIDDSDCGPGEQCSDAVVDLDQGTLIPGTCG